MTSNIYDNSNDKNPRPESDVYFPNVPSPYFRTPFTDIFGSMINHQQYSKCGRFELNMMECLEAYGLDKGRVKCRDLIEDFNECHNMIKQTLRVEAMAAERKRQFRAGEIKEQYAPPPHPNAY